MNAIKYLTSYLILLQIFLLAQPLKAQEILTGQELLVSKQYYSDNHNYFVVFQTDGNLVVYTPKSGSLWSTNTSGHPNSKCYMQADGNLVIYNNNKPIWSSGTHGVSAQCIMQNDGNLVILACNTCLWVPLWSYRSGIWSQAQILAFIKNHPANAAKCCSTPPPQPVNGCVGNACNVVKWYKNTSQGGLIFENNSGRTVTLTLRSQNAISSNPPCSDPSNYDVSAHSKFGYGIGNMTFCSPFEANYK